MKFSCEVLVVNRSHQQMAIKQKNKHLRSTLAICQQPKSDKFYIILFTAQNKNGTRYDVNGNISKVLTRFLSEGKISIQFKQPTHDLFVQADKIQLKSFLNVLSCAMGHNNAAKSNLRLPTAPTMIASPPVKKMVIDQRSGYPTRGLPRTLEELRINGIGKMSVDCGILKLQKLKILDLSDNSIEFLPRQLSELPNLASLNISKNQLGKAARKQWEWINGALSKSLVELNLQENNLLCLPETIVKLRNLEKLQVDHNQLTGLPSGLGNLRRLKHLTASHNLLQSVPGTIKNLRLSSVDLSLNNFRAYQPIYELPKALPCPTLKEIAARRVLLFRLCYQPGDIPVTLIDYLDLAKYCVCGRACFEVYARNSSTLFVMHISASCALSTEEGSTIPMDCYYCSIKCLTAARERVRPVR